jgi:uncharacterized membrane protein YfcA
VLATVLGLVTGTAAGFVGVGGGEFRIPVLVGLLRLPIKVASGVNLVVGLFTVALSVYRRWGRTALTSEDLLLVVVMGGASILGSASGVWARQHFPVRPLGLVVRAYLVLIGLWMVYESLTQAEHVLMNPSGSERWVLAALVAFVIAVASGVVGVAGGEMRIPALLYLFALPIVEAGTLSLMVSIPTLAAGALTDRTLGGLPDSVLRVALVMGVASALGVLLGAALIPYADRHVIKGVLGAVLLLSGFLMHEQARTN